MYASRFLCREKYTLISQISSIFKPIFRDHTLTMFLRVEKQNILKRLMREKAHADENLVLKLNFISGSWSADIGRLFIVLTNLVIPLFDQQLWILFAFFGYRHLLFTFETKL